MVVRVNL
jgi:hypothetical protein